MKVNHSGTQRFSLIREMLETPAAIRQLHLPSIAKLANEIKLEKVLIVGEGSSRAFPGKRLFWDSLQNESKFQIRTEAASSLKGLPLNGWTLIALSNSGRTREMVQLLEKRAKENTIGILGSTNSPIAELCDFSYQLSCGLEKAVPATKTVIEQALVLDLAFRFLNDRPIPDLKKLADQIHTILTTSIPLEWISQLAQAETLYIASDPNGVSEELVLKTAEICRKKAVAVERSVLFHGFEEIVTSRDAILLIRPSFEEQQEFDRRFRKKLDVPVYCIGATESFFPVFQIPTSFDFNGYLELVSGWNLLVEIGLSLDLNIDRPLRAKKIGNDVLGRVG